MRTERLNGVIFVLCCVAFVFQSVGYLAPAWFVREFIVKHGSKGFLVDGKRFRLVEPGPIDSEVATKSPLLIPNRGENNRGKRSFMLDKDKSDEDTGSDSNANIGPAIHNLLLPMIQNTAINHEENNGPDTHAIMPAVNKDKTDSDKGKVDQDADSISITNHDIGGSESKSDQQTETSSDTDVGNRGTKNKVVDQNEKPSESSSNAGGTEIGNHNNGKEMDSPVEDHIEKERGPHSAGTTSEDGNDNTSNKTPKENKDGRIDSDHNTNFIGHTGGEDSAIMDRPTFDIMPVRPTDNTDRDNPVSPLGPPTLEGGEDGVNVHDGDISQNNDWTSFPGPNPDMDGINENTLGDLINMLGPVLTPPPDMMQGMQQARAMEKLVTSNRILHVTAGLWYGRACVNSHNFLTRSGGGSGTEWCSLYIRTKESALDNQKNIFEFRIEASLGLGFSLLALMVAGTTCCCSSKQGTKMIMSLGCLFVSGAVMLIPVIHVIVQHHQVGGVFHRSRDWSRFMVHTYIRHDLFDHWSVILCGCGSLLSVAGSIIFAVIGCRHQKQSDTKYDLSKSETGEIRKELPVNWARNNKITIPATKMSVSTTPDSLEGEDSDYHTETRDEERSSLGYLPGDSYDMIDTVSQNDVTDDVNTGNDAMTVKESEVEFLDGVILDDD